MKINRSMRLISLLTLSTLLASCASSPSDPAYPQAYRSALVEFDQAAAPSQQSLDQFLSVYSGMTATDIGERVDAAYAPELYFSDTLHVIHDRDELKAYLQATGERLKAIEVEVMSVTHDGADVYVRWQMATHFRVAGKDIDATSIGISHLRFSDAGQVILH